MKSLKESTKLFNILCAVVMAVLLVLEFTPYWHYGEGEEAASASINAYIWMPSDQGDLINYFGDALGEKPDINNEIGTPILILVLSLLGVVLCCVKPALPLSSLCGAVLGISGLMGYLGSAVLKLGSLWGLHLGLCIAALALGALGLAAFFLGQRKA